MYTLKKAIFCEKNLFLAINRRFVHLANINV